MRTLVLHVGYPKTASSSIQWCLHANRDRLRDQGIYYPLTGQFYDHAHSRLAFTLYDNPYETSTEEQRDALFASLTNELDSCGCDTVVLSSEVLVRLLNELRASRRAMRLLEGYRLRIICFVRRQDAYLESLYTQWIWRPNRRLSIDVDTFLDGDRVDHADYHAALRPWADFLGRENVTTIVYEQARNGQGCVRTFLSQIGVDAEGLSDLDVRANVKVSGPLGAQVMRVVNGYSGLSDGDWNELGQRVKELDAYASTLKLPARLFTPEQCARIGGRFLDSNQRLAAELVGQPLDGMWFSEQAPATAAAASHERDKPVIG
jgi:hypothetical protein